MATAAGFKTPEMNWDSTDLRDELATFKQYCDLIFIGPYSKKSAKELSHFHFTVDWKTRITNMQKLDLEVAEDSTSPAKIWERRK